MDYIARYVPVSTHCFTSVYTNAVALLGSAAVTIALLRRFLRKHYNITDNVVLITGASSGIGEALAGEFLRRNCRVILAARSTAKLEDIKRHLLSVHKVASERVSVVYLDLADHDSIPDVAKKCMQIFGHIDILVNNAGIGCRDEVVKMALGTYKQVMAVNYFGQVALTKEILPSMIAQGCGSIVAISSLQGRFALPFASAYSASKHALQAFCDSLRVETAKHNIHVLVISPGYVKTNIFASQLHGDGTAYDPNERRHIYAKGMSSEYVAQQTVKSVIWHDDELAIAPIHHRMLIYIRVLLPRLHKYLMCQLSKSNS